MQKYCGAKSDNFWQLWLDGVVLDKVDRHLLAIAETN